MMNFWRTGHQPTGDQRAVRRRSSISFTVAIGVAFSAVAARAELLVHYTGDYVSGGTTQFLDSSPQGNNGIRDGLTSGTVSPKIGLTDVSVAGTAQSIDVADANPDFDRTYSAFTLSVWVNPGAAATNRNRIVAGKGGGTNNRGWSFLRTTAGIMTFSYADVATNNYQTISSAAISADAWTQVAVTYQAQDFLRLYVNGTLVSERTTGVLAALNGVNTAKFQVGNRGDDLNDANTASWAGRLDDFGLWDEALTSEQVGRIYTGGQEGLNLQQALIVPEPGSWMITATGLTGVACWVVRRRMRPSNRSAGGR